jgi:diguanylate cyclase (GGDEF)-like protein
VGSHGHVFRYAGDEFAIIVPNRSVSQVIDLGERIRAAVEDEGHVEDFNITTSIGIACSQTNEGQGLRERAEEATYVSKLTGKNRVVVSPISSDDEKLIKEARDRGYS